MRDTCQWGTCDGDATAEVEYPPAPGRMEVLAVCESCLPHAREEAAMLWAEYSAERQAEQEALLDSYED